MTRLRFQLEAEAPGSRARAGRFQTLHGEVRTPIFMPVGTQATVKSQTADSLREAGSHVLLANTYHLMLRPGIEVFRGFGGIHRFMNWDGPVLTDSGGFQIFSLPHSRAISEAGARFQSYIDGKMFLLSPETSIEMQKAIGSDIMMVLDQCIPSTASEVEARAAMELTHRWAKRSLEARGDSPQALFGIVQGACYRNLREESARALTELGFDGFAIGGLAVGETKAEREDFAEFTAGLLPRNLPRYLMGVGTPLDILEAVHRGVDMFDCIMPGALAQRGVAFTSHGKLQMRRVAYKFSEEALDANCGCRTCKNYSRAYLHHLYKCDEPLGWTLLASHNLFFYHRMMAEMRENIFAGTFLEYYREKRETLAQGDYALTKPKQKKKKAPPAEFLGDYEVRASALGFSSIRQRSSGEVMHSVSEPMQEAKRLYVEQSHFSERLKFPSEAPLVIWDVGLGAAANAMAAIEAWEKLAEQGPIRALKIISFECDLDPLRLALRFPDRFRYLRHGAPHRILQSASWEHKTGRLSWRLVEGDFFERFSGEEKPDLIYYDLFSQKTMTSPWTIQLFSRMREHLAGKPAELFTYTSSTAVRAALLGAGFFVASGASTGPITNTTIAYSTKEQFRSSGNEAPVLLGRKWLKRWERSHAKFPLGIEPHEQEAFQRKMLEHPQFTYG